MRKFTAGLGVVLVAASLAGAWQAPAAPRGKPSEEAQQHLQRGVELFDQGKLEEAKAEEEQVTALAPDWYQGYFELGQTYWAMKNLAEAEKQMRLAIARQPDCWLCLTGLGNVLDDAGRREEAVGYFKQAIAVAPAVGKPRYNLAITDIRMDRIDDAITELQAAESVEPDYASPWFLLGRIYFDQQKLYLADEQLTQATKLESKGDRYDQAKQLIDISLTLDQDLKEDEGAIHLAYCMTRAAAMTPEEYHKRFPGAETYVDNLDEQVYVLGTFAQIVDELSEGGKKLDPTFGFLVAIKKAGYLAPYVLLSSGDRFAGERKEFEAKNPGKIAEFQQWAAKNKIAIAPLQPRCEVRWMGRAW